METAEEQRLERPLRELGALSLSLYSVAILGDEWYVITNYLVMAYSYFVTSWPRKDDGLPFIAASHTQTKNQHQQPVVARRWGSDCHDDKGMMHTHTLPNKP